jgi:hypothetical protein
MANQKLAKMRQNSERTEIPYKSAVLIIKCAIDMARCPLGEVGEIIQLGHPPLHR